MPLATSRALPIAQIMRTVQKEKVRADKAKLESGDQLQTAMQSARRA